MNIYSDSRMQDPAHRAAVFAHFAECVARQERLREEQDQAIREAGPDVGDWVVLSPLLRGKVMAITGSPPWATIESLVPTGKAGKLCRHTERRELRTLRLATDEQSLTNQSFQPSECEQSIDPK
jgi:hypothetical protein